MDKLKTHKLLKNHIELLKKMILEKKEHKNRIKELENCTKEKKNKNNYSSEYDIESNDINDDNNYIKSTLTSTILTLTGDTTVSVNIYSYFRRKI